MEVVSSSLSCDIKHFPCTYLTQQRKKQTDQGSLHPLVDKAANDLPGRKASLMNRTWSVCCDYELYFLPFLFISLLRWAFPNGLSRPLISGVGVSWKGQENANERNCFVSRERVQRPIQEVVLVFLTFNVGLGAPRAMVMAAENWQGSHMVWFAHPRSSKCSGFVFCAVESIVRNGQTTLFLSDRWLQEISKPFQADLQKSGQGAHCGSSSNRAEMGADIKGAFTVQVLTEQLQFSD